ncbi:UNVERIFIED_CONTAM: Autophagy-related protein 18b [Sesamum radiatum]|uniref:Autophagy-related protein 18b n=1 Tax=Sesamum radiatum TaxID=300843 RepID=A0AAW2LB39_SESRA
MTEGIEMFAENIENFRVCNMANQSSSQPILCASFNQDNSCFVIGTRDGFKIFHCETGKLLHERGAMLCLWLCLKVYVEVLVLRCSVWSHDKARRVTQNMLRVVLIPWYEKAVETQSTRPAVMSHLYFGNGNSIEWFPVVDKCFMTFGSSLLAIVGAGEQPSLSPRRLCLFNTIKGTALRELNFLTSIVGVRVSRKSNAVVRKIEKASGTSMSDPVALRATVSVITFSGYFQVYSFRINHKHEATWTLEHEVNLLTAVAEQRTSC